MSVSGIIGILTIIAFVVGLAGWGVYAYRNPHSASGQMLIRVRLFSLQITLFNCSIVAKRVIINFSLFIVLFYCLH